MLFEPIKLIKKPEIRAPKKAKRFIGEMIFKMMAMARGNEDFINKVEKIAPRVAAEEIPIIPGSARLFLKNI